MSELFLNVVNRSISASWIVLVVFLLRLVMKKTPKWVRVLLWGIVAVRLVCPFSIESAWSLIPSAETISPNIMMTSTPTIHSGVPAINMALNPVISGSFAPAPGDSANPLQIWIPILSVSWLLGVAAFLVYTVISYLHLQRKVGEAVILRDAVYQSEKVGSPFVLGVIRPKIYLPYHMDSQDLEHVVAHESAHIRRRDHWWKPLGFLLLAIYWFNPLMWIAYILLCRDIELACDEKVIKEMENEQRADYMQALVSYSVNRRMVAACPLAFGEVSVKRRVKSVMNYRRPAFWVIIASVLTCVVVAVCFLTNPVGFHFDRASNTIVSASCFDMRNAEDAVADEMNLAQLDELSSRLADVGKTRKSDAYGGFTPGYQISALLEDGTYIRISGYSFADNDMVDIEWYGERYVVSDREFQEYLSRICASGDKAAAVHAGILPEGSKTLSLDDVVALSRKGYDLTWSDFDEYRYITTGSGLYIQTYEINEMFELWVGGTATNETPMYIYLALADDLDTRIDIRNGGVEEFITKDHSETLLNKAIYDAIIHCNTSEKTFGLNNCASFIMLDKEEISGTPVAGSMDHVGLVTVYGLALYQGYDLVDNELREEAGSHTPVAITFDVLNGKYSLKEYWRPGDGTYYEPDIRERFPDKIEDEAMDTQKYIAAQKEECYVQAMRNNEG